MYVFVGDFVSKSMRELNLWSEHYLNPSQSTRQIKVRTLTKPMSETVIEASAKNLPNLIDCRESTEGDVSAYSFS